MGFDVGNINYIISLVADGIIIFVLRTLLEFGNKWRINSSTMTVMALNIFHSKNKMQIDFQNHFNCH